RAVERLARGLARGDVARLQVLERLIDGAGRGLARLADQAGDLLAVLRHRLGEIKTLGLDRLDRLLRHATDLAHEPPAPSGARAGSRPLDFSSTISVISAARWRTVVEISSALPTKLRAT